jgi:7-carboxy-7-deazaguanine synthase
MINIQPIEKRIVDLDGSVLDVHSIFYTIQGEGPFCGHPAVFLRLAGCNLQCPSCDTEYTQGRQQVKVLNILQEITDQWVHRLKSNYPPLVVITGGEPFRQNLTVVIDLLMVRGYRVQIETNGTLAPSHYLPHGVTVVCSPKTGRIATGLLPFINAYKYVMSHESMDLDGLPIRALNHSASPRVARPHAGYKGPIYLQPMDAKDEEVNKCNIRAVVRSAMQNGYIVQLQVHKILEME